MKITRTVAALVIASILVGALPKAARADEAPINLRAAMDRAVARLDPQPAPAKSKVQRSTSKAMQPGYGGGGGGKGMMVVSLVTTVVGLAATYYVLKQMQEQSKQTGQ